MEAGTIRAVRISEDGVAEEVELHRDGEGCWRSLCALLGGYIEALEIGRDDATAYGNEGAKLVNEPEANDRATALVYGADHGEAKLQKAAAIASWEREGFDVIATSSGDPREPFVAGPVVVCGIDRRSGETTAIPDDLARELLG